VVKFLKALKSIRLAIALIAYLAVSGLLATLVPQGREDAFYFGAYPKILAEIVVQTGFSRFFSSILFMLPAFAFFANLLACTVDRFLKQLRAKGKRRHGPDMLHLGLLLLVVGSVLSFSGRQEGGVSLAVGDGVELPDGRVIKLTAFEYLKYDDGRPKDWISTVSVLNGEKAEIEGFSIRVNHPLKLGGLSIYQVSHSVERVLALRDPEGKERLVGQGEEIEAAGERLFFMAVEEASGKFVLRATDAAGKATVAKVLAGESAGRFSVVALRDIDLTGLEAVRDPGYPLVLAALVLVALGVCLTFIQKLGDMNP